MPEEEKDTSWSDQLREIKLITEELYDESNEINADIIVKSDYNEEFEEEDEIRISLKRMLRVSSRIRLDVMNDALEMDPQVFHRKIFEWAEEFGFRIDGDYVVVEDADISGFIDELDEKFEYWSNMKK